MLSVPDEYDISLKTLDEVDRIVRLRLLKMEVAGRSAGILVVCLLKRAAYVWDGSS